MQAALEFDRTDAVEDRQYHDRRRSHVVRERHLQRPVQPAGSPERHDHACIQRPAAGQLLAQADQHRDGSDPLRHPDRHLGNDGIRHHRNHLGHQEAESRARARQYRLHVLKRQDGGAQNRRAQSAQYAAGRGQAARRHQGVDHPVRHRREYRHELQERILDRLGAMGERERRLLDHVLQDQDRLSGRRQDLDGQLKGYLERLCLGPRPELRRPEHRADRRRRPPNSAPIRPRIVRPR